MTPGSGRRIASTLLLAVAASCLAGPRAGGAAQAIAAPALKAAFLLNFARFAEWPATGTAAPGRLVLCAGGDEAVANALAGTARNQSVGERPVSVVRVDTVEDAKACDVLYVDGRADRVAKWLATATDRPVLTVTDRDRLPEIESIVRLYVDNERMRFVIDASRARAVGLRLNARLLALAGRNE